MNPTIPLTIAALMFIPWALFELVVRIDAAFASDEKDMGS